MKAYHLIYFVIPLLKLNIWQYHVTMPQHASLFAASTLSLSRVIQEHLMFYTDYSTPKAISYTNLFLLNKRFLIKNSPKQANNFPGDLD
jgi:hypothetical protein